MLAVKSNNIETVEVLLANGANPHIKDRLGQQAGDYCKSLNAVESNMAKKLDEAKQKQVKHEIEETELAEILITDPYFDYLKTKK